jgi:plastocyanin
MMKINAWLTAAMLTVAVHGALAGDITGTISLKGTPPAEKDIVPLKEDPNCGKLYSSMPTTRFYVVGAKGELADVVVALQGVEGKSAGDSAPPAVLDQKACEYVPQIMAVQTGQKVVVKNSDQVLHNVHDVPTDPGNSEMNKAQLPGSADLTFILNKPEMFVKFKCEVHPWMFAWVSVFDHPYFAISAKDGTFKIANVPPGKYTIKAFHRKAGEATQQIEVKAGEPAKVDFTLEAK